MKTIEEVNAARLTIGKRCLTPGLQPEQTALLTGILNALVWVAGGANCSTMERLLGDEPIAVNKDLTGITERLQNNSLLRRGKK